MWREGGGEREKEGSREKERDAQERIGGPRSSIKSIKLVKTFGAQEAGNQPMK